MVCSDPPLGRGRFSSWTRHATRWIRCSCTTLLGEQVGKETLVLLSVLIIDWLLAGGNITLGGALLFALTQTAHLMEEGYTFADLVPL